MPNDSKIAVITAFVQGVEALKAKAKEDALVMAKACPLEVLADPDALAAYLEEMMTVCMEKHLLTADRKIRPGVASMIKRYVKGMQA